MQKLLSIPLAVRVAVLVWAVLLIGVTVRIVVSGPLSQTVVPIYLTGAMRWVASEDLYPPIPGMDLFHNPPVVAAGFVPFLLLPAKVAGIVWRLLSAAVFLTGLSRFARAVSPNLSIHRTGWMFALAAVLALSSVNNGQINLMIAGGCLAGAAAAAEKRWWAAAGWFGVGFGLKLYPLAVGMLAAVAAPRKLGPRLVLVAAGVSALPFLVQSPGYVVAQHENFVTLLGLDDRTHSPLDRVNRDWTILARVWFGVVPPADVTKLVGVAAGLAMAAFAAACARKGMDGRTQAGLALALGSVWVTLFGPATEAVTYTLVAGVGAWQAVRPGGSRWARGLAWVGCGLLAAPIVRAAFPGDWAFTALGPQPTGAILLLAAAVLDAASEWPIPQPGCGRVLSGRCVGPMTRPGRLRRPEGATVNSQGWSERSERNPWNHEA